MDANLLSFVDELQKIAYGPKIIEHDISMMGTPSGGLMTRPEYDALMSGKLQPRGFVTDIEGLRGKTQGLRAGQDVVALPTRTTMRRLTHGNQAVADLVTDIARKHELTHWLQNRKGQLPPVNPATGMREGGLRNVGRVFKAEMGANLASRRAIPSRLGRTLMAVISPISSAASTVGTYDGLKGLGRALIRR